MQKLISINDTDKAVAEFLKANNIHYSVKFVGSVNSGDWKHDKFIVNIGLHSFDYKAGIGNRLALQKNAYKLSVSQVNSVKQLQSLLNNDRLDNTVFKLSCGDYAVSPTQASVLYCLLLDADCGSMSFDDFCDNCGYNADSISDFKTYQACMETTKKINKIFNHSQRQQLADLLQDC